MIQERNVYSGLTLLCLLLISFAAFFRLRVSKNVLVLFGVFGFTFATRAGLGFLEGMAGAALSQQVTVAACLVWIGCMMTGALLCSRDGEKEVYASVQGHLEQPARGQALVRGLQTFNRKLSYVLKS